RAGLGRQRRRRGAVGRTASATANTNVLGTPRRVRGRSDQAALAEVQRCHRSWWGSVPTGTRQPVARQASVRSARLFFFASRERSCVRDAACKSAQASRTGGRAGKQPGRSPAHLTHRTRVFLPARRTQQPL